jgi:hypothetical protein
MPSMAGHFLARLFPHAFENLFQSGDLLLGFWGLSVARRAHGSAEVQRRRAATAQCVRGVELIDV